MRRGGFRMRSQVVLLGALLFGAIAGTTIAESRLGNDDRVFSYSSSSDRVAFGGMSYAVHAHSNMEHPDASILYRHDVTTGVVTKAVEAPDGRFGNPQLAPSGHLLAVQLYLHQGGAQVNPKLLVLTEEGREVAAFAQSHDFAWSPDSRFLAYTVGEWIARYTFQSTGTWIYDARLKMSRKIFDRGEYVAWSQVDHSLYIWDVFESDRHILRYDLLTQQLSETNLQGIFVSPTGRYYHSHIPKFNEGRVEVYDAASNQPILHHRPRLASVLPNSRVVAWAPEGDVLILEVFGQGPKTRESPQGRVDTVLYDVAHDIARVIQDDSVIGWQHGHVIVHDRGKFAKRAVTSLPLLPDHPEKPAPPAPPRRP